MGTGHYARKNVSGTWRRYLQERRVEDRNELVTHYVPLADSHAARMVRRLSPRVSYDEIRSAAFDGLMHAVESYDPHRQTQFESYCRRRLTGAVLDWLRSVDTESRAVRSFEKNRSQTIERLRHRFAHRPSDAEVAAHMRLSSARFARLSRRSRLGNAVLFSHLEQQSSIRSGSAGRRWDAPDERAIDPAKPVAQKLLAAMLTRGFTRDERMVLLLYYFEQLTMAEVGSFLKLSESRVSQIHKDVLGRLRQRFGPRLREELSE
ncbi:MAG: sigma-70 family RNA polymerase sigma factor [Phycisphaerales bacterium]|nr:sigma-70 family RNA polymerase sigma factor [Phycisphaerales bacterium]